MIDTKTANSHSYYVIYLRFEKPVSLSEVIKYFTHNSIANDFRQQSSYNLVHFQVELPDLLGMPSALELNKGRFVNDRQCYWYDFYVFNASEKSTTDYFLCYLYSKLHKFIDSCLDEKSVNRLVLKPRVEKLLDYLQTRGKIFTRVQKEGLIVGISKYSASIQEPNAKKLILFGENPLESFVYDLVRQHNSELQVEPLSLRLKCNLDSHDVLEISFDRLGNGRFWIKKNQENVARLLPLILRLFDEIEGIKESPFINRQSYLDPEENEK